jgi:hypothetical protein
MATKAIDPIDNDDFGIEIRCALTFTDSFDPTGATFALEVDGQASRAMTFSAGVASYVIQFRDFGTGYHTAQVRVTKGGVSFASERFIIPVLK